LLGTAAILACAELPDRRMVLAAALGAALALAMAAWVPARLPSWVPAWVHTRGVNRAVPRLSGASSRITSVWRGLVPPLACAVLAAAWTTWLALDRIDDRLPHALEGVDLVVTGRVVDLPQTGPQGLRFRFEPESAARVRDAATPVHLPERLAIGWTTGWHEDATLTPPQASLRAGQRWTFTLRLRRPHGNLNPHGFDMELQWFEQGIGATGYVRDGPQPPRLVAPAAGEPVARMRQAVRDAIVETVADRRAAGVLAALAIGDQSAILREDWDLFRATGIAHLVSISGLHVTMFAWVAGAAIGAAWRRSARACLWLAAPHAARWGGVAAALGYAVLAGWGVPAQRTVWMLALVALLASCSLAWPWMLVLLGAAVLVAVLDPWALLQPGFWLSFVAVGVLMASDPARASADRPASHPDADAPPATGWRRLLPLARAAADGVRTQWTATLGLTPLGLVFFQQVSLVGLLANLVAIPLVTLLVTPLALLGVLCAPLWQLGAVLVQALSAWLGWLASWPGAVWTVGVAPAWAQAAGLLAALVLILPWPWRLRCLALPLALPLLMPPRALPEPGRFELLAVDVGQGTAVLVRTRAHLLLFDAGPQYARDSDAGQRVLLPLLRARGERRIDTLVLSHRDIDHVGGARSLLRAMPVGTLLSSLEPEHPLLELGAPHRRCEAGQAWTWDGVRFEVLRPPAADHGRLLKPNALSCVLRVSGSAPGSGSALLTGDIERDQELALVMATAAAGQALRSDVLVVPHHGSRTSSSAALLDAVRPRVAVFQAGYRNRFGHPAPDVLARYHARGIAVVASPLCGAWRWWGDAAVAQAVCERERAARHWHDRPPDPAP
jgi:competence protein ComEC